MAKYRGLLAMAAAALLTGAAALPAAECQDVQDDSEIVSWRQRYLEIGELHYEWACAACHAEGKDGAPAIGDRDAWSNRSPLWSGVLLEHAKKGYLEMPAKGGHPYLSDRAIEAAGEYMLSKTFPELPRD